ncbi:MAG: DNA-binding protein WhiA, partial [Clostridia bacterium]|nr:DNA-binding protein WhiA [Clostridia bacterium]
MNFSKEVKKELISENFESSCCKRSALSAYIRSAGVIETKGGKVGFDFLSDGGGVAEYFSKIIEKEYGILPETVSASKRLNKQKSAYKFLNDKTLSVLVDLGLAEVDEQGVKLNLNIDAYSTENDCCKTAYIKGMFLGSGSVTLPTSSGKATG